MDFLTLPRRDLQALCKRNGVRANMTSAAMADALRALPKVEGIEEYIKVLQPVSVPQTAVKPVNEEQKQESPLPRGRRVTAQSSEPIEPEEDKEKDAKRQSNKEDVQQVPGVGRRGANRRARPVPAVPQPLGKAVAEEDGQGEENLKRETKRDNAPAPVVGRLARPSPVVIARAAESEVAGVEEEQSEEVEEDLKREASMDDALALGVGRRGASRRTRPAPSVAALAGKVVADEEQRAPIPRGRRVKAQGSSTEPIGLDASYDEEKEESKPVEEQDDAQIVGVGRRGGASRRAQAAPATAITAPEAKTEEEQRAPTTRGRRVKAKSTELTRLDDSNEEKKEDTKPEEERGDAPAVGVGRRAASRRAPSPSKAPATRRSGAASKAEAGDVAVEVVSSLATRQRKLTMKAAAAAAEAEEKAPRRATRRGGVTSTLMQQEVQEKPQEAMGAPDVAAGAVPIQATRQRKSTMKAATAATTEEKGAPKATRRGAVITLLQQDVQEEPKGVLSDAEAVGAPVSHQRCDALEEMEEASDPQKEELNELDAPKQDEDEDVVINDYEKLMQETPAEGTPVTDQECTGNKSEFQEQQVDDDTILLDCSSENVEMEKAGNVTSEMPENQAALDEDVDKPNEVVIGDMSQDPVTDKGFQEERGVLITDEMQQGTARMHDDMDDQFETVFVQADQVVTADKLLEQVTDCEITVEENTTLIVGEKQQNTVTMDDDVVEDHSETDGVHSNEQREAVTTDNVPELKLIEDVFVQSDHVVAADNLPKQVRDCEITMETTSLIVDDEQQSIVTMDGDLVKDHSETDNVHADEQMEVVTIDEVIEVIGITVEDVEEKQKSTITMDKDVVDDDFFKTDVHADEQMEVATTDEVPELTETDYEVVEEKQQSTDTMNGGIENDDFKTHVAHVDEKKEVVATEVPEVTGTDGEIEEKTPLIVDEKKRNTVAMDGDVVFDHLNTDTAHADEQKEVVVTEVPDEVTGTGNEVIEEKAVVITEGIPNQGSAPSITHTMDGCVKENHFGHVNEEKKAITADIEPEMSRTQDGGAPKENASTIDVTESLSRSMSSGCKNSSEKNTTEPIAVLEDKGVKSMSSGCKNSSEKNATEPTAVLEEEGVKSMSSGCKNSSEKKNTTEPMAVLEEKGVEVAKKPVDLYALSLGKLKAKLKETLNAEKKKEAKRLALARVDENVCRSKGQQRNLNLRQH